METQALNVIVADDHPVVLAGVRAILKSVPQLHVAAEAHSVNETYARLADTVCDVLVTDYSMPDVGEADGLSLVSEVRRRYPLMPIVVLTMMGNPGMIQILLAHGVLALVDKSSSMDELPTAILSASRRRRFISASFRSKLAMLHQPGSDASPPPPRLSPRETEVVRMLALGATPSEVAERLGSGTKTVSKQKKDAMRKLGLATDAALFEYVRAQGWLG
ncbi:MAG TPA: response regulator transcription factor [Stenotrophomonas sp.]|nr:response regulator transcription factor [Stenotrophomonas sp.]